MLSARTIFDRDGLQIADIACHHGRGRGVAEETPGHGVGFVRRGCFARSIDGERSLLDPSSVFFVNPAQEQRYDHPHDGGDDCTAFLLSPELTASLWGGDPELPTTPLHSPPTLDLTHRLLLADVERGADPDEIVERGVLLLAATLEGSDRRRVQSTRPSTNRARLLLVDEAREALAADPGQSLATLATRLSSSPHHLSRTFRSLTGHTISRHRMRLRARAALERLASGEHNLARLGADLGFADQGHLCRVIRDETGSTPSELRTALSGGEAGAQPARDS
jgi:AraC-like DNA-binding protein